MNQDPITKTMNTYDQIASDYAEQWQERGAISEHVTPFVEMVPAGSLVCDLGCGPGFDTVILHQHGFRVIGLDRSWGMIQAGRKEYGVAQPLVQTDMRHLPLGKTAVDALWLSASLLHLPREDVGPTLKQLAQCLKPGGILYLSVKMGDDAKWMPNPYKADLPRFFTYWQPETLDPLLIQAGFKIIDGWENQGRRDRWLVRFARLSE